MNIDPMPKPFQFRLLDALAVMTLASVLGAVLKFSGQYLPPIDTLPPFAPDDPRNGRNWIGQGGWACAGYAILLVTVHGPKNTLNTSTKRKRVGIWRRSWEGPTRLRFVLVLVAPAPPRERLLLLLGVAYRVKWHLLTRCTRPSTALYFCLLCLIVSLPYIWFLCVSDWFNPFLYRASCWIGGPVAIWTVPVASFLVDLCCWGKPKRLNRYLIRSGIEIFLGFPLWAFFWAMLSFFVLGWGWM
jgi:hypothetical protein